ncbi:MAG: NAD(P)-dependent oxidoreductase [Candidatus Moranbacteria bacterium]|nr:NAD(P)-dependent oxidoreductase [Candidatus Moranbacteria bacterium]
MQKIIIIGANGTLGQELALLFSQDEAFDVIAWDEKDIDITDEKDVKKKISELKPDIILNTETYDAIDKCEDSKSEYEKAKKLNGLAPGYLAKAAKKAGAVLVHYSSDYVFNGEPEIPEPEGCSHSCATCGLHEGFTPEIGFKEDDMPDPISNYGESRLLGEKNVIKNIGEYYIIRTSKLFGRPADAKEPNRSFFDLMLEQGKNPPAGGKVKVIDEEVSCFTYAPDLAKKTKEIIESKKAFGIYHVANTGPATWYEAVLELYRQAKIKTKVTLIFAGELKRSARRPFYSALINTKLNPMRKWEEALKDYLKEVRK